MNSCHEYAVCHSYKDSLLQTRQVASGTLHLTFTWFATCFTFFSHKQRFKDANLVGGCSDTLPSPAGVPVFVFCFFSPTNRDSKMQTRWVVALTLCIHLLVVPLETCLSFHPFCQLVSVGEVPVTKVQRHSHKGPLLKSGQPYVLYLYSCICICLCICVFLSGFVFVYLYFTGKRSVILTKAHYCKRPTLLCLPRSFLLQYTKQQIVELWMF